MDADNNPTLPWRCSPLEDEATAVVLVPIINEDFTDGQGPLPITVYTPSDGQPYVFAFYWIAAVRTYVDLTKNSWAFISSGGQGQAEIDGVFIIDHPVNLGSPPTGDVGAFIDCDFQLSTQCFIQLVG